MHFIQRMQFSKTNVTSHAFQQISDLKIFPERFRGPLKTLWQATCSPRACSWTTLICLMQHRNIYLYFCIACEWQSLKRVFYLKQIFVIKGDPLGVEGPGQLPPLPHPFNPALTGKQTMVSRIRWSDYALFGPVLVWSQLNYQRLLKTARFFCVLPELLPTRPSVEEKLARKCVK